jgi:hypothetical protein
MPPMQADLSWCAITHDDLAWKKLRSGGGA